GYVIFGDVGEIVIWTKEQQSPDSVGVGSGQPGRDTGPKGLTNDINGRTVCQKAKGFGGCIEQRLLRGRTGAIAITRVFEDVNIYRPGALQCASEIDTVQGRTGVAMDDKNLRRCSGCRTLPANSLARRVMPGSQTVFRCGVVQRPDRIASGMVKHTALAGGEQK